MNLLLALSLQALVTQKVAERRRLEWQVEALQDALGQLDPEADFPTANSRMQRALALARQVAPSNATVLICGEVGTGKGRPAGDRIPLTHGQS